ncbi:hypothetical protein D9758_010897 [Tetrapyrgos nigripes]|uniref:Uncharacterized protein n=1 Tax=Tetrapyrgos nigripes TaxID=182062 RepID=A0A8H5FTB5_9AGAR|nr:hypothetical protein D9758_010897 [Tetrapyrgos nigripes]
MSHLAKRSRNPPPFWNSSGFSVSQQRPNVSDAELEHSHATLSGNALIRSERDYFFGADMITQARKRTTSMLSKASSFGPFSPCLSPLSLSPLGHPLFQDAAPAPRSPSEGSDSTWSSGSDSDLIDESFSDSNTNPLATP